MKAGMIMRGGMVSALCAFLSACAVTSKTCSELTQSMNNSIAPLRSLKAEEARDPDAAIVRYIEYLRGEESFDQPLNVYQEDLKQAVQQMETSPTAVLSIDSISGFSYYYNKRLGAIVRSYIGLGRAYIAKNNLEEAEKNLVRAVDIVNRRNPGSYRLKQYQAEAHRLLRDIYTKQGHIGKALVAKLNTELVEDYLKSEEGLKTYFLEKHAYFDAQQRFADIDKFVAQVNAKRLAEADRQMREIMGAVTQVASTMAQAQMDRSMYRNSGFPGHDMGTMQMNKMMLDVTMKIVSAASGGTGSGSDLSLNPMADTTVVGQLMDRRKGSRTFEIIKAFVNAAADLSNDESIRKSSRDIIGLLESVREARSGGYSEKTLTDVSRLAETLSSFQTRVQAMGQAVVK